MKQNIENMSETLEYLRRRASMTDSLNDKVKIGTKIEALGEGIEKRIKNAKLAHNREEAKMLYELEKQIKSITNEIEEQVKQLPEYKEKYLNHTNEPKKVNDIAKFDRLYEIAMKSSNLKQISKIANAIEDEYNRLENKIANNEIEANESTINKIAHLKDLVAKIDDYTLENVTSIKTEEKIEKKKFPKLVINTEWFKKKEKEKQQSDKKIGLSLKKKALAIGIAASCIVGAIGGYSSVKAYNAKIESEKEKSDEEAQRLAKIAEDLQKSLKEKTDELNKTLEESKLAEQEQAQESKEDQIIDLVSELRDKLNSYDGINVTMEQSLALYIHLNAANSYTNSADTLALDKLTRQNLIKKYYIGLTKDDEEFATYEITDEDLSRLSADVQQIRNALVGRVIVLNSQGDYQESREIIGELTGFITEQDLQDEAKVLTESIQNMQTSDSNQVKKEIYRYYNYIFAGPVDGVRNFDGYEKYMDADSKEMTFENQGTTIRFYTWFMDAFVDIRTTNNLIPNDIINSKTAKLMDQANLLRILGYKNCNAFNSYFGIDFDTAIDNKTTKKSSKSSSSSSSTSKSNVAQALESEQLDIEMNVGLQENTNVGDSFTLSDNSTVTVVESGPSSTTVVVTPDPSSEKIEDTTPSGPSKKEETEGGGNEKTEEIIFEEDPTEEVIDKGGEIIYDSSEQKSVESEVEGIIFKEDSAEEVIDEGGEVIYDSFEQESFEFEIEEYSADSYSIEEVIEEIDNVSELKELKENLIDSNSLSYNYDLEYTDNDYVKTYHI